MHARKAKLVEAEELDPVEEREADADKINIPFDPANVDIIDRKFTISALLERLKNDELNLTPNFQRRANLWDNTRKSRLIESILLRIPLPSFYFSEDEDGNFDVVDGLQRLCAVFQYIASDALNHSTDSDLAPLALSDLQYLTKIDGFTFEQLDRQFQRRINELEINVNIIRATTPKAVMFNVFARLNQGGLPLSAQEIRNAIYPGKWREHIRNVADSDEFLTATNRRIPTNRQQDMEMVLRFFALFSLNKPYHRPPNEPLDMFLNNAVADRLERGAEKQWNTARKAFFRSLDVAQKIFDDHAFRKSVPGEDKLPINKGLFEAQLIALTELSDQEISQLIKSKKSVWKLFAAKVKRKGKFSAALTAGTGSSDASIARIDGMRTIFREVLDA